MLTLILMRHAKSSWKDASLHDHDRPLNKRGQQSAKVMGDWLRQHDYLPGQVLSSTSRRTMQTFAGLDLPMPVQFTKALYHAGPNEMLSVLHQAKAPDVLMLGHNPGIADFAEMLLSTPPSHPRFTDYPTCATTVIRWNSSDWTQIGWRDGQPIDFAIPREQGA